MKAVVNNQAVIAKLNRFALSGKELLKVKGGGEDDIVVVPPKFGP